jgi:enoyl-CoA hydratase
MSVHLTRQDEFALITLDRQEALNALSAAVLRELAQAFEQVAAGDARALIITGAGGKAFCAGADIKELTGRNLTEQRRDAAFGQAVLARLDTLPMPSVAAINGYAFGGGLELALACDLRIIVEGSELGMTEVRLGIIPGAGGTQRLPRLIGEARAKEMILLGRRISAARALEYGLVTEVVGRGELPAAVARLIGELDGCAPLSVAAAKAAIERGHSKELTVGIEIERECYELTLYSGDRDEGLAAFAEGRPPRYRGR